MFSKDGFVMAVPMPFNPCHFCRAECCKTYTITVTAFDMVRIVKHTGKKPGEFAVLHEARLLSYDPDLVLDFSDHPRGHLLGIRSHPCTFLERDRCTIHDCAPLSCRRYPFQIDGKFNPRFCPLPSQLFFKFRAPDIGTEQLLRELESYKKLVKEWNKKKGTKAECLGFLMERAKRAGSPKRKKAQTTP